MLSYIAIALAGILVAAALVWVTRSLTEAGRETYRTVTNSAGNAGGGRFAHLNNDLEGTPVPWGWGGKQAPAGAVPRSLPTRHKADAPGRTGELHDAQETGAVRSVLTGYDMKRESSEPDTSCWPYRDNIGTPSVSFEDDASNREVRKDRPTKPWGW
jgi:hypothetical protein